MGKIKHFLETKTRHIWKSFVTLYKKGYSNPLFLSRETIKQFSKAPY